jgi:putative ABC transport system permease protein
LKGLSGPYLFCSAETGRQLLRLPPDQVTYLLVRCRERANLAAVQRGLKKYRDMAVLTRAEFSTRSRCHWLFQTGAGIALSCAAVLGLLVGGVITNQTLYAATVASLREYAVLRAMGIPRRWLAANVLIQSFWVGLAGVLASVPLAYGLAWVAGQMGAQALLPAWLVTTAAGVTLLTALLSGVATLRALRLIEPALLLR